MSKKIGINDPSLLRERFDNSGRSDTKYARAKGFEITALVRVLNGTTNGKNARKEGQTRKVICHLKDDGIWIGVLPWMKDQGKEVT